MKNIWREEYTNLFLDSFMSVMESIVDKEIKVEENVQHSQGNQGCEISVIIGFVGDIKGQANFAMEKCAAMNLTSILAGGMDIFEIDDLVKSAVGEFANMVMGGVCTKFSAEGIFLDITPPSIITGEDYQISGLTPQLYKKISITDIGKIFLDIAVKYE